MFFLDRNFEARAAGADSSAAFRLFLNSGDEARLEFSLDRGVEGRAAGADSSAAFRFLGLLFPDHDPNVILSSTLASWTKVL